MKERKPLLERLLKQISKMQKEIDKEFTDGYLDNEYLQELYTATSIFKNKIKKIK